MGKYEPDRNNDFAAADVTGRSARGGKLIRCLQIIIELNYMCFVLTHVIDVVLAFLVMINTQKNTQMNCFDCVL